MIARRQFFKIATAPIFLPLIQGSSFDLQTALNSGARVIDIPAGEYTINTPIVWPVNGSNITLRGAGIGITTLIFAMSGIGIKIGQGDDWTLQNITIENMSLRGATNDDNAPDELIQFAYQVSGVTLRNLEFSWARQSGLRFTANTFGHRCLIDHCYFHDINTPQMAALSGGALQGAPHETVVRNCQFINTGNNSLHHALYANATEIVKGLEITGCVFDGLHTRLHLFSNQRIGVTVTDNQFRGNSAAYFYNCVGAIVANNQFFDTPVKIAAPGVLFSSNTLLWDYKVDFDSVVLIIVPIPYHN